MMENEGILSEIESIKKQIIERYKPDKIILFGSAVGRDRNINDIDLFIIKKDVPYYGAERMSELYRLINTCVAVDYIVYKPEEIEECLFLGDPFIKKIFKEGVVLYG
ncbi:MAG: nucleotidyltransferase domain-containing protein [bacterium]